MGLDMYAFTKPGKPGRHFHYWRKHYALHDWMEALYRRRGGTDPDFNLVSVALGSADLDELEIAVRAGRLPRTAGNRVNSDIDDDLRLIAKARAYLAEGREVFYLASF